MFNAYRNMDRRILPDIGMFVPLFIWHSGKMENLKCCNLINRWFFKVPQKVLLHYLMLNRQKGFPSKYPKANKDENKLQFYYDAVRDYYDWTNQEMKYNFFFDTPELREVMANRFAFTNAERKLLGLEKVEVKKEKLVKSDSASLSKWF